MWFFILTLTRLSLLKTERKPMNDNIIPLVVLEKIPEGTPPPMQHYRPPPKLLVAKKHKTHQALQLMIDALAPFQPEKVHPQGDFFTC